MRILFLISLFLFSKWTQAQVLSKHDSTLLFLINNKISINSVIPPPGFKIYYNCDSALFLRGDFKDTIRFWTPSFSWRASLEDLPEIIKDSDFGQTKFIGEVFQDGDLFIHNYHQTEMIVRNDSLFEIADTAIYFDSLYSCVSVESLFAPDSLKTALKVKSDSLKIEYEKRKYFTPKLIFARKMFTKVGQRKKIIKSLNFLGDTIELVNKWSENGRTCYSIKIDNNDTSYGYHIDDRFTFIQWQGCFQHFK